ncbi:NAD(P)-binding protein [Cryphonectria parasitica EP155]|uniref:Dehydrogenase FUB6 n=1 Tax=Cryphonectria parasitica (strain ATCC 38755 / EP155) TaxID=660469 RepID=A0A9P5CSH7_CRYP1|nr:NAD(P)-binding protein [Cryphonectria parasitica EP155]KAF3768155.1 NAD(P)-binding protein [Cryphonectria parasitica EP155]
MSPNKTLIYKRYTPHLPVPGEHLTVEQRAFDPTKPPPPGGITIKNTYLSPDPYQRGQMRGPGETGTYSIPWVEGQPAVVMTIATVIQSDAPGFKPGDHVLAMADAAEYAVVHAEMMGYTRLIALPEGINIGPPTLLGALGVAGLSAYVSFNEYVTEPRAGKTILISAASGAVGQLVGQMAKMHGMKVIGSTGSQAKVDFVTKELGFDGAWNYKAEKTADALTRLAPEGLDFYYDNVGGEQLEVALTRMKDYGHIIVSGMMSVYMYPDEEKYGIRTGMNIFLKRLTLHGFICSDAQNMEKYMPSFPTDMVTWILQGAIKTKEEVVVGIDNMPDAMVRMWTGDKFGKMVVQVDKK